MSILPSSRIKLNPEGFVPALIFVMQPCVQDSVNYPEWDVPFHVFKYLAEEYYLELILVKNSHEFVHEYMKKPEFVELMRKLGALGDGNQNQSTLSADEWEAAYLYFSFVLRKRERSDGVEQELRKGIITEN